MKSYPSRILCVDNDEDTCLMMKIMLGMWNYEVVSAPTAADGFRFAQSERFDLFLLDTRLPDESGVELCARICELEGHAPVIFISCHAYETDKLRGLNVGALDYLTKPLDFNLLEETMARTIKTASHASEVAR